MATNSRCGVIIMAAGQGKRMLSAQPKVLNEIGGKSLLAHILTRVKEGAPKAPIAVVVGFGKEEIERAIQADPSFSDLKISFVFQPQQNGTGDAVKCAMESPWGESVAEQKLPILVLPGDLPLIPTDLIAQMSESMPVSQAVRLLTCDLHDPTGYGRIVRKGKAGGVLRIVEERDANLREKQISEVGASIYLFNCTFLKASLKHLVNRNSQKEYYLTDLIAQAVRAKKHIDVLRWHDSDDVRGVNNPWELALAGRILNERVVKELALQGVRFIDPMRTWINPSVQIAADVTVYPNVILCGGTVIGKGCTLGPGVFLKNTKVGEGVNIKAGTLAEDSVIEAGATVGPYANLRPGSVVGKETKIGNFVELKNSRIGQKTSIAHLSYVGDAEVGNGVNIGCGFVTCNFDGRVIEGERKHKTVIEDDVFVGSDCQTVAPIRVGRGAYIASGSTITEDVESEALAIARSRQVTKPHYARKLKGSKESS